MYYSTGYCTQCKKQVKIEKDEPNYFASFLLLIILGTITALTLGGLFAFILILFWIFIEALRDLNYMFRHWRCSQCGGAVKDKSTKADYK